MHEPRLTPSRDRLSASRRSQRHRHNSNNNHSSSHSSSTPRSAQTYDYYDYDMSANGANGQQAADGDQPQARRDVPNIAFVDIQIYDPPAAAQAGQALAHGMFIRATSTAQFKHAVEGSSAVAYLYAAGSETPVVNGTMQATAQVVDPDPNYDIGFDENTITVQYEFPDLAIQAAGTYCYRVLVTGGPADDGNVMGLGLYDSATIVVS